MSNAEWTWLTLGKCMVGSGLVLGWQIVLKRKTTNGQEINSYQCSTSLATGKMESKGLSSEPRITNAGLGCGKGSPFYHWCQRNSTAFMKSVQIMLSNSQKTTVCVSHTIPGHIPRRLHVLLQRHLGICLYSCLTARKWNWPGCSSADDWTHMAHTHDGTDSTMKTYGIMILKESEWIWKLLC